MTSAAMAMVRVVMGSLPLVVDVVPTGSLTLL